MFRIRCGNSFLSHLYFCQSDLFIHVLIMPVLRWHMSLESFCTFGGSVALLQKLDFFLKSLTQETDFHALCSIPWGQSIFVVVVFVFQDMVSL